MLLPLAAEESLPRGALKASSGSQVPSQVFGTAMILWDKNSAGQIWVLFLRPPCRLYHLEQVT